MTTGHQVLSAAVLMIFFVTIGIVIGYNMKSEQLKQYPIYTRTIVPEFHPGDTLTSNESGAWILWDNTMIRELQVAYVTDSGTIEVLK